MTSCHRSVSTKYAKSVLIGLSRDFSQEPRKNSFIGGFDTVFDMLLGSQSLLQLNRQPFAVVKQVAMRAASLRFFVLTTALLLALPPGWCQAMSAQSSEKSKVSTDCCGQPEHRHSPTSEHAPSSPVVKCCCVRDAVLPEDSIRVTHDFRGLNFVTLTDFAVKSLSASVNCVAPTELHAGPRLQILQCQWRC